MKTTFQRILTKDHIELAGLLYEPDTPTTKVLVHVHGMAGNFYENSFLDYIAQTLTSKGIAFFTFNNRGCEIIKDLFEVKNNIRKIVRIGNAYEIFEDCILDIQAAIDFVHAKGFTAVHLSGHSLGSPKIAFYMANTKDSQLSSMLLLSPSDMVGLSKAEKNHEIGLETAKKMIAEEKGKELLPFAVLWDESPLSAQSYVSLTSEESKVAIFNFYKPDDELKELSRITIPTVAIMGRNDDALVISIEETMARIEKALVNAPRKETIILGNAGHGYNGFEQQLADVITDWVTSI